MRLSFTRGGRLLKKGRRGTDTKLMSFTGKRNFERTLVGPFVFLMAAVAFASAMELPDKPHLMEMISGEKFGELEKLASELRK